MRLPIRLCLALSLATPAAAQQEVILQYFNTSWTEIEARMPELAEAGYSALWLPNPCKGSSGGFSVGYDPQDRFDLGDKDQAGSVRTRYGTKAELLSLVEKAHRFGIRVYFDNVMAHSAGSLGNTPVGTLIPGVPGHVPQDFHLGKRNGYWSKFSDSVDYNDEWQVLNRNPFAWDIAQENPNTSFDPNGTAENSDYPKWVGIRHPGQPWLYLDTDLPIAQEAGGGNVYTFANKEAWQDIGYGAGSTGAGNGKFDWQDTDADGQHDAGETSEPFSDTGIDGSNPARRIAAWGYGNGRYDMGNPVAEDVNGMLIRSARWTMDVTNCDGYRLDAVKHVPSYFFGQQNGLKDGSGAGYLGQIQEQFNATHGYDDWSNHRDSNYSLNAVRQDAILYGEHLGAPPNPNDYLLAGMKIANDNFLNAVGPGIGGSLQGYDSPGAFTFGVNEGMMYCMSHDNNYMAGSERPAAHRYMLMRAGLPIVYTDGYNHSSGPDYFPKQSHIPFLGQYGQNYVTGPLRVRRDFLRGDQIGKYSNQNFAAWEFRDKRENNGMSDADGTTLLVMMARNYTSGQGQPSGFSATWPNATRVRNYSEFGGAFYANVGNDGRLYDDGGGMIIVPSSGYFAFAPRVPEMTEAFDGSDSVRPITVYQGSTPAPLMNHSRKDGKNGDPAYAHTARIPRITDGTAIRFVARADGSAVNMHLKLDGNVDVNSQMNLGPLTGTKRDYPAGGANSTDVFEGWEQARFVRRIVEKFAAADTARNIIGSPGAETWEAVIGTAGWTRNNASSAPDTDTNTVDAAYHDPAAGHIFGTTQQFTPPASAANQSITIRAKLSYTADGITNAVIYYTITGTSYPEGSAGTGRGDTQVAIMTKEGNGPAEAGGTPEWWRGTIPALPAGTKLRYKIGAWTTNSAAARYPSNADQISKASRMETIFEAADFNADTVVHYPHNNKGIQATGLKEGLHIIRSRAFLDRGGKASLYNTRAQTFYLDRQRAQGMVRYPECRSAEPYATIGGTSYGVVAASDDQTTEVWYSILDSSAANDSAARGNGTNNWAKATAVTVPTSLAGTPWTKEWRFDYLQIPASGVAQIRVRFKELSSSADNSLTDVAGHYTTETCTVNTGYPVNFGIAFPAADGETVGTGYVAKCLFDKSLGNAIPDAQLLGEFSVWIASTVSGEGDEEIFLPRSAYSVVRNETPTQDALAFTLPNLFNGDPDFLHHIRITWQRGDISLSDTRLVKAWPDSASDADGDGLPDFWENMHRLEANNPGGDNGAAGDADGDGFTNLEEYRFLTNPRDAASTALLNIVPRAGTPSFSLQFPVSAQRRYRVQVSTDLSGWTNAGSEIAPASDNAAYLWTDPATAMPERKYYRVTVRVP